MAGRSALAIGWIEGKLEGFGGLRVPEGRFVGESIRLREFQKRDLRLIYDNPAGTRRAILSRGRKNSKTGDSAMLLLLHLAGPFYQYNSQLYSAAQSREQAAILFKLASKMVRMSPDLSSVVTIRESTKEMICEPLGTYYRALSADASTTYGLSPVFAVHDELGQVRGPHSELYEAVETGMAAHEKPLSVVISTQAPTDDDLLSRLIDDAESGADPRTVVSLYTAPIDADPFAKETIKRANPAFGDFQSEQEIMDLAAAVSRMPSREAWFRNLVLNQRVEANAPLIARTVWEANGSEPEPLGECYGGLDLSEVNDLTSLTLVGKTGEQISVKPIFWLPGDGLREKSRQDRVSYDVWAEKGHLRTCDGPSVEYEQVALQIAQLFEVHDIRKIAFDRWNMRHLRPWLIKAGLSESFIDEHFVPFGQGYQSMSPAIRIMESYLLNNRLRHGKHPVLTMCAANAVAKSDEAGNRKLDKKKSTGRIDGIVTLAMALSVLSEADNEASVFDTSVNHMLEDMMEA